MAVLRNRQFPQATRAEPSAHRSGRGSAVRPPIACEALHHPKREKMVRRCCVLRARKRFADGRTNNAMLGKKRRRLGLEHTAAQDRLPSVRVAQALEQSAAEVVDILGPAVPEKKTCLQRLPRSDRAQRAMRSPISPGVRGASVPC